VIDDCIPTNPDNHVAGLIVSTNFLQGGGTKGISKCLEGFANALRRHGLPNPKYFFTDM
jgi:hypothetical protein